jgi:hypothetical protein
VEGDASGREEGSWGVPSSPGVTGLLQQRPILTLDARARKRQDVRKMKRFRIAVFGLLSERLIVVAVSLIVTSAQCHDWVKEIEERSSKPGDKLIKGVDWKKEYTSRAPDGFDRILIDFQEGGRLFPDGTEKRKAVVLTGSILAQEFFNRLEFRDFKECVLHVGHGCLGMAQIYFYKGDKEVFTMNHAHGHFQMGLLTETSEIKLADWFASYGIEDFKMAQEKHRREQRKPEKKQP